MLNIITCHWPWMGIKDGDIVCLTWLSVVIKQQSLINVNRWRNLLMEWSRNSGLTPRCFLKPSGTHNCLLSPLALKLNMYWKGKNMKLWKSQGFFFFLPAWCKVISVHCGAPHRLPDSAYSFSSLWLADGVCFRPEWRTNGMQGCLLWRWIGYTGVSIKHGPGLEADSSQCVVFLSRGQSSEAESVHSLAHTNSHTTADQPHNNIHSA